MITQILSKMLVHFKLTKCSPEKEKNLTKDEKQPE